MKNIKNFILINILLLAINGGNSFAQKSTFDRSNPPLPSAAKEIQLPEYQSFTLSNGLQVFVIENHKIPQVTYNLVLTYDSNIENDKVGIRDLFGEMLRNGTKNRTKDQIDEELDMLGVYLNTTDKSLYSSCLKKHNVSLLEIISDIIQNPVFPQVELDKLKVQYNSALQVEKNEPESILRTVRNKVIFGENHPYGEKTTQESLNKIQVEDLVKHYNTYYKPNGSYLAIVGDVTVAEIKPLIEKYFGTWQKGDVPKHTFKTPEYPIEPQVIVVNRDGAVQSNISVAYPISLKIGEKNETPAKLANTVLGGGSFRLFNNLREKNGWTYGAYSQLSSDNIIGNFNASTQVRNVVTDSAVNEILYEMERMSDEVVPTDELALVKNYTMGSFGRSLEDPRTIARFAINTARYNLPNDYYSKYLQNIEAITPNDIKTISKQYILPKNSYIIVVGNADEVSEKLQIFSKLPIRYFNSDGKEIDTYKATVDSVPAGYTVKTIFDKYIQKIGGEKKLTSVKTLTQNGETTLQGMKITIDSYVKQPDQYMMQMSMQGMILNQIIYNKGKAIVNSPMQGQSTEVEDDKIDAIKSNTTIFPELTFENEKENRYKLIGIEKMDDNSKAYKIEILKGDKLIKTMYYDTNTFYKVKEISNDGSVVSYSDYKSVDGILFPHNIKQTVEGMEMELKINNIAVKNKIDSKLFEIK